MPRAGKGERGRGGGRGEVGKREVLNVKGYALEGKGITKAKGGELWAAEGVHGEYHDNMGGGGGVGVEERGRRSAKGFRV